MASQPLIVAEHAVLVELEPGALRQPAYGNAVRNRAGEVAERRTVAILGDDAEVDLQPGSEPHGRAGRPVREHGLDLGKGEQALGCRGRIGARYQHIEVAHALPAATVGAGDDGTADPARATQMGDQRLRDRLSLGEGDPAFGLGSPCQLALRVLLGLLAEPVTAGDATCPGRQRRARPGW